MELWFLAFNVVVVNVAVGDEVDADIDVDVNDVDDDDEEEDLLDFPTEQAFLIRSKIFSCDDGFVVVVIADIIEVVVVVLDGDEMDVVVVNVVDDDNIGIE